MKRISWLDVAIWALIVLCVVFGVGAALAYRNLSSHVAELKREQAALVANKAIASTAFTDLQELLRQPVETPRQTCEKMNEIRIILEEKLSSAQREGLGRNGVELLNLSKNTCATLTGGLLSPDYRATRDFVDAYVDAVDARIAGKNDKALAAYERALAVPNGETVGPEWRMRALEGVANAKMHLGDYPGAQAGLDKLEAERIAYNTKEKKDYRFVFEDITRIKLACLRKAPAADVTAQLAKVRSDYDAYAATREAGKRRDFALADRQYIEDDAELRMLCAYAAKG